MTNNEPAGSFSFAGWAAIASGAVGILAYGILLAFLMKRSASADGGMLMLHDGGVILQFLLMIPVVFGLQSLSRKRPPGLSRTTLATGIGALSFVVLLLLLIFPKIVWDVLYMFPHGIFGGWLMLVNWRLAGLLPRWLRWFGLVVGFGLVLVGLFPVGYAVFVDPVCLRIPVVLDDFPTDFTPANALLHQLLLVGSYLGVATLPLWSALLGWRLLRTNRS